VKELDLPEDFDDAKQVHRTIMLYEGAREHAPRQALHRRVMSTASTRRSTRGLAISHEEYRARGRSPRRARRAGAQPVADCDAIASLPAPGAGAARLDITGDPSFCTLWTRSAFPRSRCPPVCPKQDLCLSASSSRDPCATIHGCCASPSGVKRR